jgi:hypothetical protein
MQVLWNGSKMDTFKLSGGIKQGFLMSSYIFMLCLKRLVHLIQDSIKKGIGIPLKLEGFSPLVSYLCFLDDMVLFFEVFVE